MVTLTPSSSTQLYSYLLECPHKPSTVKSYLLGSIFKEHSSVLCGEEATSTLKKLQVIRRVKFVTYTVLSFGLAGVLLGVSVTISSLSKTFFRQNAEATPTKLYGIPEEVKPEEKPLTRFWNKIIDSKDTIFDTAEKISFIAAGVFAVGPLMTFCFFIIPPIGFHIVSSPLEKKSTELLTRRFKDLQKDIVEKFQKDEISLEEMTKINRNRVTLITSLLALDVTAKVSETFISLLDTTAGIHQWQEARVELNDITDNDLREQQLRKIALIREQILAHALHD